MGIKDFLKRMVEEDPDYDVDEYEDLDEEEEEDEEVEEDTRETYSSPVNDGYRSPDARQSRMRVTQSPAADQRTYRRTNNIETIKPAMYSDAHKIIDKLREGNIIVFSLELVDDDLAIRILDFVYGGTFALNGTIKEVGTRVYVVTNQGIRLGEISNSNDESND